MTVGMPSPVRVARFLLIYAIPTDPAAFDRHYHQVHVPLTRRLPDLRRYTLSRNVTSIRGDDHYYLIAQLEWDSLDALRAAFASQDGRAAADDMANLTALSTVRSMVFEVDDI